MNLIIKTYYGLPCACEIFTINGVRADLDDFGCTEDISPETARPYSCGCRQFIPDPDEETTIKAMQKYHLSEKEFEEVCAELAEKLFVGSCGLCV